MDLNTYNQVAALSSNRLRALLSIVCSGLLIIAVSSAVVFTVLDTFKGYKLAALIAVPLLLILLFFSRRQGQHCQFCHHSLSYITRPMLLTQKLLAKEGIKQGDYFYTRCYWGVLPFKKRWVKISNRTLACHHCRLTEHHSREHYQQPMAEELAAIKHL